MSSELRWVDGDATLADAHAVRRDVFIEGQDISESLEMDGRDDEAFHVVAYATGEDENTPSKETEAQASAGTAVTGYPVATARLRIPEPGLAKPERVAVRAPYRETGIGRQVMRAIEDRAREKGCTKAKLHAQVAVEEFYHGLGYETTSDVFEEAGIPHVEMVKEL